MNALMKAICGTTPVGAMQFFPCSTPPRGWLVRDGSARLVSSYPALAAYLHSDIDESIYTNDNAPFGYRCSNPSDPENSRTPSGLYFTLPDARGRHDRGLDMGAGREPTDAPIGATLSDEIGSHGHTGSTNSAGNHTHTISFGASNNGSSQHLTDPSETDSHYVNRTTSAAGAHSHTVTIDDTGGLETRVKSIVGLPCIYAGMMVT